MELKIEGQVKLRPLNSVKPNTWNPNRMTERQYEGLKHGLREDGWIASQALLIWGKDDKGEGPHNIIIDGEHRWKAAGELGFAKAPMVVLDGLTYSQARALTIKLDNKRGQFDRDALGELLRDISNDLGVDDVALDLGFGEAEYLKLMVIEEPPAPPEFKEVNEDNLRTDHQCPKCGFEF